MKRIIVTMVVTLFVTFCGFSQSKKKEQEVDIITHEVKLGESVRMLSKKYLVDPAEIYKLNKFAVEGISEGMVLQIPVPRKAGATVKELESTDKVEVVDNQPEKQETVVVETVPQKEVQTVILSKSSSRKTKQK
ncbi:MAG: LysM peptidoglycan-binding domain-containing protein [Flavobacterium sp.]|nr:LysM peptidoglycan-binding domain-containing protein [Flavobacterium sp.]